jgi:hypothetical protein
MTLIFAKTTKKIVEYKDFGEESTEDNEVFGPKLRMKNNISKKMANLEEDQSEVEEL